MKPQEQPDATRLLDVNDVADMLNVSVKTVYGWVYDKRIPHLKPSRSIWRFRRSDIEAWLDGQAVPARGNRAKSAVSET